MFDQTATEIAHEVAIRTGLSFRVEVEIEERWPCNRKKTEERQV
jgi:hypothetical protein